MTGEQKQANLVETNNKKFPNRNDLRHKTKIKCLQQNWHGDEKSKSRAVKKINGQIRLGCDQIYVHILAVGIIK